MSRLSDFLTTLTCLVLPRALKPMVLNALGHRVHRSARIGPILVRGTRLQMGPGTSIGPLNLIACRRLVMRERAYVAAMNALKGRVSIRLGIDAAIGNRNVILRGSDEPHSPAYLWLGEYTKITASHYVECTNSLRWGDFGTLAGVGSQIWTHGFVHAAEGVGRVRITGVIRIGHNVYIGSHSVVGAGVTIADGVSVGAHSSVASDLTEAGVYVSGPLRHIARSPDERVARLELIRPGVYRKGPRTAA